MIRSVERILSEQYGIDTGARIGAFHMQASCRCMLLLERFFIGAFPVATGMGFFSENVHEQASNWLQKNKQYRRTHDGNAPIKPAHKRENPALLGRGFSTHSTR